MKHETVWDILWRRFKQHRLGMVGLIVVAVFCLIAIYAPFLASSKPIFAIYDGEIYFPLFRYLFYTGFYTKPIDIFFNLLIFTFPIFLCIIFYGKRHKLQYFLILCLLQGGIFLILMQGIVKDPASDITLNKERQQQIQQMLAQSTLQGVSTDVSPLFAPFPVMNDWNFELKYMNDYAKLNILFKEEILSEQHQKLLAYAPENTDVKLPTLWQIEQEHKKAEMERQKDYLAKHKDAYLRDKGRWNFLLNLCAYEISKSEDLSNTSSETCLIAKWLPHLRRIILQMRSTIIDYEKALVSFDSIKEEERWIAVEKQKLGWHLWPLIRRFHWQEDAGGEQSLNQYIPWWELTRINRKDMVSALIFGTRISLVVGITSVALALLIGIPIGAIAGYFAGRSDIVISRFMEIWEAMPTFFMLLLVVAITQSKSIFLIIAVIGLFGWTRFSRFLRGEFLKQRNLSYVEACKAQGFNHSYIIFSHILPNAIPPLLTLLPFAIMGAITSETGLAFLGLGEEGSSSWGVLMDEARQVFPGESYLLWPPALLLTVLLVAIAMVGDALRDALDPRS